MFGLKRDVSDRTVGGIRNPFVSEAAPLKIALITASALRRGAV